MKKAISLALASVLAVSLAACGSDTGSGSTASPSVTSTGTSTASSGEFKEGDQFWSDEPLTYSLMYSDHENYPAKEDWLLWSTIKERTNVSFDINYIPRPDYDTKKDLLISSGQASYIIPKMYAGQEGKYIASGALIPISDWIQYMPNYQGKIEKWGMESDLNRIRQTGGSYYILPGLNEKGQAGFSYLIRKDIFDEAGVVMDDATYTYDNFYEDLKKVKELYPDHAIFSDRYQGNSTMKLMSGAFGVAGGNSKGTGAKFDFDTEKFYYYPITDEYKAYLTYFNKLVKEGLYDVESFTQTDDQAIAKFTAEQSFVIGSDGQAFVDMNGKLDDSLGAGNYETYLMTPPGGPAGQVNVENSRLDSGLCISRKALDELGEEKFIQMLQFVDWLWYSDEGRELCRWGVEGVTYKKVDNKHVLMPDVYYAGINQGAPKQLNVDFGFYGGNFSSGSSTDDYTSMMAPSVADFFNRIVSMRKALPLEPPIMATADEAETDTLIWSPLMDYVNQASLQFITGELDIEANWDEFVSTCEAQGASTYIDHVNTIYQNTKQFLK